MPVTNVTVRHTCGCERPYALAVPPNLAASIVAQLREQSCGQADCPLAAQRLLARHAPAHVNGKAEP